MSEKSHVSLEQHVCVVCCQPYETGTILLDKRLRNSMERHTVTGWGMCDQHAKLRDDGFVALIGVKNDSGKASGINPEDADRTGTIAHLKKDAFAGVFNIPVPARMVAFVDQEVIDALQKMSDQ